MELLPLNRANLNFLQEENERLHKLVNELTAQLTIEMSKNDSRTGSNPKPKSRRKAGAN